MQIEFVSPEAGPGARTVLAIAVPEGEASSVSGGAHAAAVAASRFTGARGQVLEVSGAADRVILVGAGQAADFDSLAAEQTAAAASGAVKLSGLATLRAGRGHR